MGKIVTIDPSLNNLAMVAFQKGEIVEASVIKPKPPKERHLTVSEKNQIRLGELIRGVIRFLEKHTPVAVAVEQDLGSTQSAASTRAMALVAGMLNTLAIVYKDIAWEFIRVADVKRAITGKHLATKNQMIEGVLEHYPNLEERFTSKRGAKWTGEAEHIADAVAVYLAFKETSVGRILCPPSG